MRRVCIGFLVCATAVPAVVLIGGLSPASSVVALMIGYVTTMATICVAMPVYVWSMKRRLFALWPYLGWGLLGGAIVPTLFTVWSLRWEMILSVSGIFAVIGGIHATVFWLVAIYRNAALHSLEHP